MVIRILAYTLVALGLASLSTSTAANTMYVDTKKEPLLKEGEPVECFGTQNCVHSALWQSDYVKQVRNRAGINLIRAEFLEVQPNTFIVAIPDATQRKQLFMVELDVELQKFGSKKTVTSKSTITPVVLSGE